MILSTMWQRYKILISLKEELTNKGYNFQTLSFLNAQIDLLNKLIKEESFNVLEQLLRKTNYRLLNRIEKGEENLVSIFNYPDQWRLCKIDEHCEEWVNKYSLVFSTEREILCFTQNNYGQQYINNKWQ